MSDFKVTKTRIFAGIWEGVITSDGKTDEKPKIEVVHLDEPIQSISLVVDSANTGVWQLRIAIPPEHLSDGVQVFLINDKVTGEKLDSFTIITGEPMGDDIRVEVELLRAELDLLKRAFRRHCLEI